MPHLHTHADKAAEHAIIASLRATYPDHAILGEENGVVGDVKSEYLWCIDPIDGRYWHAHVCVCVCDGRGERGSLLLIGVFLATYSTMQS